MSRWLPSMATLLLACAPAVAQTYGYKVGPIAGERPASCAALDATMVGAWTAERSPQSGRMVMVHGTARAELTDDGHSFWVGEMRYGGAVLTLRLSRVTPTLEIETKDGCRWLGER